MGSGTEVVAANRALTRLLASSAEESATYLDAPCGRQDQGDREGDGKRHREPDHGREPGVA